MTLARYEGLARAAAVGFWLATALLAWLMSVPFVHENFIQPRVLPGLMEFAEWHPWLIALLWPAGWVSLQTALGHRRSRVLAHVILGGWALAGFALPFAPALADLAPDRTALVVSTTALLVPLLAAVADLLSAPMLEVTPVADRTARDLAAALLAAAAVVVVYGAQAAAMHSATLQGLLTSALTHTVFVGGLFLLLTAARSGAALLSRAVEAEFWAATVLLALALAGVVQAVVVRSLSITDPSARAVGALFGVVVACVLAARGRHAAACRHDGVVLALSGLVPSRLATTPSAADAVRWLVVVAVVAWSLDAASRVMDWNFVLATLAVVVVWLLAVAGTLAATGRRDAGPARTAPAWAPFAGCLAMLAAYHAAVPPTSRAEPTSPVRLWSMFDPSFRVLGEALRPAAPAGGDFYAMLQRHTNLGPSVTVTPVRVQHARLDEESESASLKPHVFVFVIDSLRRDYVSAYNSNVGFTPALARFASESVVFEHAFTRYGATGLSVPSIWVGGLVPHKQYPEPFTAMNALHALLRHERYTSWISRDNIVDEIVPKDGAGPALDATTPVKDLRFCATVDEIRSRLGTIDHSGPAVFAWALPQDLHIAVITREGATSVTDADYTGFYAPYASRLQRLDSCFGAFINDLKARGLYDDSLVVVTSDHGDSLGEEGRWGHTYTIFPEVLQVPLIVHVPERLRERFQSRPREPAYTADLTPSLYALLGHTPTPPSPVFGRTLFWPKGQPAPRRLEDGALVASSYGSVYGWLSNGARELYIADGVDYRDYLFRIDGSPAGESIPVTDEQRRAGQDAIRASLDALAAFYQFIPGS